MCYLACCYYSISLFNIDNIPSYSLIIEVGTRFQNRPESQSETNE